MSNINGDYISREAAIQEFATCGSVFVHGEKGCKAIVSRLQQIQPANVRPMPKAQWVELPRNTPNPITGKCGVYIGCSNCHAPLPTDSFLDYLNESDSRFCYSCGAEMRGESNHGI